jgi:hypothetical protein
MRMAAIVIICVAAAGLVGTLCPTLAGAQQPSTDRTEPGLDPQIGEPNAVQYRSVRDAREWRNPYLDVSNSGFLLRSASTQRPIFVPPSDLRRVLTELPTGDWPYGRVVVVQLPSVVPADAKWIAGMRRNVDVAKEVLAKLGVEVWGWPA